MDRFWNSVKQFKLQVFNNCKRFLTIHNVNLLFLLGFIESTVLDMFIYRGAVD